jgi:hypothetical protein
MPTGLHTQLPSSHLLVRFSAFLACAGAGLKRSGSRLAALSALIAALALVILVASISVLLIVGLWKLYVGTAPFLSSRVG